MLSSYAVHPRVLGHADTTGAVESNMGWKSVTGSHGSGSASSTTGCLHLVSISTWVQLGCTDRSSVSGVGRLTSYQHSIFGGKFYNTDNFPRGGAGPLGNDHNLGPDGPASLDISHLSKIRSDCKTVRGFSPRVVSDVPRTFLTSVK